MKKPRVLLTGKDGQASLAFADLLSDMKEDFVAFGRKELDITDLRSVREAIANNTPKVVFNGAAFNDVDRAEINREQAFLVNGIGPRNLSIACEEADIPLITFSTDYVFNGAKGTPYTVIDAPNPINVYGESKLLGEQYVQSLCSKYILARVSWVFGVKGKAESCFPKKVIEWSKAKKELYVVDDQVSSPTYAPDLVKVVYALLMERAWGICHITNEGFCSRYEWAKEILDLIGWGGIVFKAKSCDFSSSALRPEVSVLDNLPLINKAVTCNWREATADFINNYLK